jgi:hypothetical protein
VIKEGDSSPRHTNNSDEVSDESQGSDKFHCSSATTYTKRFVLTMKGTNQWTVHGLAIQVALVPRL